MAQRQQDRLYAQFGVNDQAGHNEALVTVHCTPSMLPDVESMSHTDVKDLEILKVIRDGKELVTSVRTTMDGSSDPQDGEFGFSSVIQLRRNHEKLPELLEGYSAANNGRKLSGEAISYVVEDEHGNTTAIVVNEAEKQLILQSCNTIESDEPTADELEELRHGTNYFHYSFGHHMATLQGLLEGLQQLRARSKPIEAVVSLLKINPDAVTDTPAIKNGPEQEPKPRYPLLSDFAGYHEQTAELREIIQELKYPEIIDQWGAGRISTLLLQGESGAGTTMIAHAIANELEAELVSPQIADIYDSNLGETEKRIRTIFDVAATADKPTVLLLNRIETILLSGTSIGARIESVYKEGVENLRQNPKVLMVATSRLVDGRGAHLPRAGRFDVVLDFPKPGRNDAALIIKRMVDMHFLQAGPELKANFSTELDYEALGAEGENVYAGLLLQAVRKALREKARQQARAQAAVDRQRQYSSEIADYEDPGTVPVPSPVLQADLIAAIQAVRPIA